MFGESKVKVKRLGKVKIFEISGNFKDNFALRGDGAIRKVLRMGEVPHLFFNLQHLKAIDETGAEVIVRHSGKADKAAVLVPNEGIRQAIREKDTNSRFVYCRNPYEITEYFAREFAEDSGDLGFHENRQFVRLPTVLPIQMEWHTADGVKELYGVVTNLSEGGMFAEFLQARDEETAWKMVETGDFKQIKLRLSLPQFGIAEAYGRVVHGSLYVGGVGMEFIELSEVARYKLQRWIERALRNRSEKLWAQ